MTFVPGYEHDLFVSYAHIDNKPMSEDAPGWVTMLVDKLETRLAQKLGRAEFFKLWKDDQLSRHEGVTPQLLEAVKDAATCLVVLSPSYLASKWCLREKDTFLEQVQHRRVRTGTRVFLIEREEVERDKRPPEFVDLPSYRFWQPASHDRPQRVLLAAGRLEDPDYVTFFDRVEELAGDLAKELERLKEGPGPEADTRPCVYLAEVTDDLDDERDKVCRYLDQAGVRVLPEALFPRDPEAFRSAMEADLSRAQLYVQLLGGLRGKRWPNLEQGCAQFQYEIARESDRPIYQWRSPELDLDSVRDPTYRELLEVETVRAEPIEEFKREIERKLFEEEKSEPGRVMPSALVFVNSDPSDRKLAEGIREELKRRRINVSLPLREGKPSEIREDLEYNLETCSALLIVYGEATASWVRRQLLQCHRSLARRDPPLPALALYRGPPEPKSELDMEILDLREIDCTAGLDHEALESFLDAIE